MLKRWHVPAAVGALAIVGGGAFWVAHSTRSEALSVSPERDRDRAVGSPPYEGTFTPERAHAPADVGSGQRASAGDRSRVQILGRVHDALGDGIPGALVELCPLLEGFDVHTWRGQLWAEIELLTSGSITSSDGTFSIPEDLDGPFALIVSKAGYLGRSVPIDAGRVGLDLQVGLVETRSIQVTVRDEIGEPYAGARVHMYGAFSWLEESRSDSLAVRARRVIHQQAMTDSEGNCSLPAFVGLQVVLAEDGAQVSKPYAGVAVPNVELVLSPGFSIRGQVTGVEFPMARSRAAVVVQRWSSVWEENLGHLQVREDGSFGPFRFVTPATGRGALRAEGGNLLAEVQFYDYPPRGGEVFIEVPASLGEVLPLRVVDSNQDPMANAAVAAYFKSSPQLTGWEYTDQKGRT